MAVPPVNWNAKQCHGLPAPTTGDADKKEYTRVIAQVSPTTPWSGKAILPDGSETSFNISKKPSTETEKEEKEDDDKEEVAPEVMPLTYPMKKNRKQKQFCLKTLRFGLMKKQVF